MTESQQVTTPMLFACDACPNSLFATAMQLEEHVQVRHRMELFPDCESLEEAGKLLHDRYEQLAGLPAVQEKVLGWGRKAFQTACMHDSGPQKMTEAHRAREQLEIAAMRWHPSVKVFLFGSSVALGVWDGVSDLDFTIVDLDAMDAGTWDPNEKTAVRSIAHVLQRGGFSNDNLDLIPFARVPILKHHANVPLIPVAARSPELLEAEQVLARTVRFSLAAPATVTDRLLLEGNIRESCSPDSLEQVWWDRRGTELCVTFRCTTEAMRALTAAPAVSPTNRCLRIAPLNDEYRPELFGVDFDLSFRVFGVRNSQLLKRYLQSHACARPGSVCLKDWSKSSGVNNSQGGFFTSYAINILWIFYLVQREVIPYIDPAEINPSLRALFDEGLHNPMYVPMEDSSLSADEKAAQQMEMGRLLLGFFRYYAFEFDWQNDVVSLNRREVTKKSQLGWENDIVVAGSRRHTRYSLCIEDPYEEDLNLGRHIGATKAKKVLSEFRRSFISMLKDPLDQSCVFAVSDAKQAEVLAPPAAALFKLSTCCVAALSVAIQTSEKAEAAVPSDELRELMESEAKSELELALKCWSWPQLLHRLGCKLLGGTVYWRRSVGVRSVPPPINVDEQVRSSNVGDACADELTRRMQRWSPPVQTAAPAAPGHIAGRSVAPANSAIQGLGSACSGRARSATTQQIRNMMRQLV